MSVIFKTLKKLRGQSLEGKEGAEKLKRRRNIYSFRRIFFSPLGILSITLFIFFSGMATLYGVRYLRDYLEQKGKESFLIRGEKSQAVKTETGKERDELAEKEAIFEEATAVPPPPEVIPIEEARPGKLYLPATRKKEAPDKEAQTVRYIPPRFLKEPIRKEERISATVATPESPISLKETSTAILSPTLKVKEGPEQETKEFPAVAPGIVKSNRAKAPAMVSPSKALQKLALKERSATVDKRLLPERPIKPKETKKEEDKHIHLDNVEKSAKTASLVAKIQRSMSTGRSDQIEDLIGQLALLKGEDNSYVLKLKAFWCLKQHDYESAASLLNMVLKRYENDLEAGINMAILEIKTDQLAEARKRLARLREVYPENTLIPELIRKLK